MNDILGLVDSLEALILESPRIPMTEKLIVVEKDALQLIDKIRMSIKNGNVSRAHIDINKDLLVEVPVADSPKEQPKLTIADATTQAKKIKQGANDYAEYVLSNLQLSVTKLQNQIIKLEKNIENGRDVLEKQKAEDLISIKED
jgi:hypothetical protein